MSIKREGGEWPLLNREGTSGTRAMIGKTAKGINRLRERIRGRKEAGTRNCPEVPRGNDTLLACRFCFGREQGQLCFL